MARKPKVTLVSAGSLVEDMSISPREVIDDTNFCQISEALRVGVSLPPIIADASTRIVVDGIHRIRAYVRLFGAEHMVEVEFRDYADRAAMFLDSIAINASHGRPLSPCDRTRCIARAKEFAIDELEIARVLSIEVARVESIFREKVGYEEVSGRPVALKRPFHHLAQTRLTPEQMELNRAATGRDQLRLFNDIIKIVLTPGALDIENALVGNRVVDLLKALCQRVRLYQGDARLNEILQEVRESQPAA